MNQETLKLNVLNSPASRTVRNQLQLFIDYLVSGIFVIAAKIDQDTLARF
jgi:hypothetical protein